MNNFIWISWHARAAQYLCGGRKATRGKKLVRYFINRTKWAPPTTWNMHECIFHVIMNINHTEGIHAYTLYFFRYFFHIFLVVCVCVNGGAKSNWGRWKTVTRCLRKCCHDVVCASSTCIFNIIWIRLYLALRTYECVHVQSQQNVSINRFKRLIMTWYGSRES